jgi:hypothetical protein
MSLLHADKEMLSLCYTWLSGVHNTTIYVMVHQVLICVHATLFISGVNSFLLAATACTSREYLDSKLSKQHPMGFH